jgi:hypothetical protein
MRVWRRSVHGHEGLEEVVRVCWGIDSLWRLVEGILRSRSIFLQSVRVWRRVVSLFLAFGGLIFLERSILI